MDGAPVGELGEGGLLARLLPRLPLDRAIVPLAAGDDGALLRPPGAADLIATCDMLVEGIHFRLDYHDPEALGHKALAVNLSDVAGMGGRPLYALLSLALPASLPVAFVDAFYAGLAALARRFGVSVVGGDTVGSPGPLVIDCFLLGQVLPGGPFRADAGRPGDALYVTGSLGRSAAGLALLERGFAARWPSLVAAHLTPEPRLREAAALAAAGVVRAARDVSDGLSVTSHALAAASGCRVEIWLDRLPLLPELADAAAFLGRDPGGWLLHGGEEYELLFSAPPDAEARLAAVAAETGTPITRIGRLTEGSGVETVDGSGRRHPLAARGYGHFGTGRQG